MNIYNLLFYYYYRMSKRSTHRTSRPSISLPSETSRIESRREENQNDGIIVNNILTIIYL